ncbi:glycosyltransferase family 39 protein [Candidatus Sumerlaeota bacterium]|nr:glycosyltransferase family 39 protein [Candidatus Sumerlaeota bacterium]
MTEPCGNNVAPDPSSPSASFDAGGSFDLKRRLRDDALLFLALLAGLALLGNRYLFLPPHWDALAYYYPAVAEISGHMRTPFLITTPDSGHPTLLFWLLGAVWRVQRLVHVPGGPHWPLHLAILLFSALTLLFTYRLAREVLGRFAAGVATLLLMLHPVYFIQSLQIHLDIPLTAAVTATTYFFWKRRWGLFWISAALMALCKAYGAFYLLIFVVWTYFASYCRPYRERGRYFVRRSAFYLSPAIVFIVFMILRGRAKGYFLSTPGHMAKSNLMPVKNFADYVAHMVQAVTQVFVGHGTLILLSAALAGWGVAIVSALRSRPGRNASGALNPVATRQGRLFLLFALQIPLNFFLWSIRPDLLHRYFLPMYPGIFILGTAGLVRLLGPSRVRLAVAAAAIAVVFVFRWDPSWSQILPGRHLQAFFSYNRGESHERLNVSDETTLGFVDYVHCIEDAAAWLSKNRPDARIVTHYPLNRALDDPDCGYVPRPLRVVGDSVDYIENVPAGVADTYVFSSINVTQVDPVSLGRYFELDLLERFEHGRHFVEIYRIGPLKGSGES